MHFNDHTIANNFIVIIDPLFLHFLYMRRNRQYNVYLTVDVYQVVHVRGAKANKCEVSLNNKYEGRGNPKNIKGL